MEGEKLGWYPEPNIIFTLINNEGIACEVVGTFRSTNCLRAAPKHAIKNNTCQECQKIPTFHSLKERLRLTCQKIAKFR